MKSISAWPVVYLLATLTTPAVALVGTEDADMLVRGQCELEFVQDHREMPDVPTARVSAVQAACGVTSNNQLSLAYARESSAGETSDSLELNGKLRISRDVQTPLQFALAWGGDLPRARGESRRLDTVFLNLGASHDHGNGWTTHANLGVMHSRLDRQASTTWAVAAERAVGGGMELGAELFGDDRNRAWRSLSVSWGAHERLSLEASWARQGGAEGERLLSAGLKLVF